MRLDHLLSKEEEVRVLYTVQFSRRTKRILVPMRPRDTPVPIPNTTVKTWAAENTTLETMWEDRWVPGSKKKNTRKGFKIERTLLAGQDKGAVRDDGMLTPSSREVLLYNWSLPVIRKSEHIGRPDD